MLEAIRVLFKKGEQLHRCANCRADVPHSRAVQFGSNYFCDEACRNTFYQTHTV